ncbi:MAG: response regulator [Desulfobacterales bacterium]
MEPPRHTILFVDDEKNILNSLKRLLRKEDYRILNALSGEEGLKILAENEVHLVITDLRMPKMNGIEFLTRLKVDYPDLIRIILTGYTDVDTLIESINKGHVYKFFLKPWNDDDLKIEIRKALERYDLIAANKRLCEKAIKQN